VVLGDTSRVPNQGPTIASETIQITAVPLRKAAAQARQFLIARAAERLDLSAAKLTIEDGLIRGRDNRSVSYGELIAGETIRLDLTEDVPLKPVDAYTIVGQSTPRVERICMRGGRGKIRGLGRRSRQGCQRLSGRRFRRRLGSPATDLAFARADPLERGCAVRLGVHAAVGLARQGTGY
jgi:hypothetical protein